MNTNRRVFRVSLSAHDVDAFLDECEGAWDALDTGERIATDEGPDAEVVLLLARAQLAEARASSALMH